MTVWQRLQRGWPTSYPLVQFPNAPLLVALAGWLVAALSTGDVHAAGRGVFYVFLSAWAWLELTGGINVVRRVMGAGVLVYLVIEIAALI